MNWKRGLGEVALIVVAIAASLCVPVVLVSVLNASLLGPADYVGLMVLKLAVIVALTPGALSNAAGMVGFGLLIGSLGMDVNSGVMRDLWVFTTYNAELIDPQELSGLLALDSTLVVPLVLVFGFLLPLAAAYASEPATMRRQGGYRLVYHVFFFQHCIPALLLMRQPWVKPPWVLPCIVFWGALLCVWLELPVTQIPLICLGVFVLGLFFHRLNLSWPPFVAGFMLSPLLEENLRRSLLLSRGSLWVFLNHPISAATLGGALLALLCGAGARALLRERAKRQAAERAAGLEQPAQIELAELNTSPSCERTTP